MTEHLRGDDANPQNTSDDANPQRKYKTTKLSYKFDRNI